MLLERDFESVKYPETTKIITDSHYDLKGKSSREPQKKKNPPNRMNAEALFIIQYNLIISIHPNKSECEAIFNFQN